MKVFDLHCDTLYKVVTLSHDFSCSNFDVQTDVNFDKYLQCFAVWVPDDLSVKQGRSLFDKAKSTLIQECKKYDIKLINSLFNHIKFILREVCAVRNSLKHCLRELVWACS